MFAVKASRYHFDWKMSKQIKNVTNCLCFTAMWSKDSSTQRPHHEIAFTSRASSTIRHNIEIFHWMLSNLMLGYSVWCSAKLFDVTLHRFCVRFTIRHYAEPFHATLHCLYVRCTILHYAEPLHATLHRLCVRCAIRHYPEPFQATLHLLVCALCYSTLR